MNTNTASTEGSDLDKLLARNRAFYFEIDMRKGTVQKHYFDDYLDDEAVLAAIHRYAETMAREELEKLKSETIDAYYDWNAFETEITQAFDNRIAALTSPDGRTGVEGGV